MDKKMNNIDEFYNEHKEGILKFIKMGINNPKILERKDVYSIAKECINSSSKKE